MWTEPEVCFMYDKGNVIVGHITYNTSWKEEWINGGNPELCMIEFREDETPKNSWDVLRNVDVKKAVDKCKNDFSFTTGMDYDEWRKLEEKEQDKVREKALAAKQPKRGQRRYSGIIDFDCGAPKGKLFINGKGIMDVKDIEINGYNVDGDEWKVEIKEKSEEQEKWRQCPAPGAR